MSKKYKILCSVLVLCFAVVGLIFGIIALTKDKTPKTIKGSIVYDINDGLLDISTKVYKYNGEAISEQEAKTYFTKLSSLTEDTTLSTNYKTFDENNNLLPNVKDQEIKDIDFSIGENKAYFVMVNVLSKTKNKVIKVDVTPTLNVKNAWFVKSEAIGLVDNGISKQIVFALGLNDSKKPAGGDFKFTVSFDNDENYVASSTGILNFEISGNTAENNILKENTFTELTEMQEFSKTVKTTISQNQILVDPNATISIVNYNFGGFLTPTKVSYVMRNIQVYDAQNAVIQPSAEPNISYITIPDQNFNSLAEILAYFENKEIEPVFQISPTPIVKNVEPNETFKGAIVMVYSVELAKCEFDMGLSLKPNVKQESKELPYDYAYQILLNGDINIIPGKNTTKQMSNLVIDKPDYDFKEMEDYILDVTFTPEEFGEYFSSGCSTVLSNHANDFVLYGNPLVFMQISSGYLFAQLMSQNLGGGLMVPVPVQEFTYKDKTFSPNNWFYDLGYIYQTSQSDEAFLPTILPNYIIIGENDTKTPFSAPLHMFEIPNVDGLTWSMIYLSQIFFGSSYSFVNYVDISYARFDYCIQNGIKTLDEFGFTTGSFEEFYDWALNGGNLSQFNDYADQLGEYTGSLKYVVTVPGTTKGKLNTNKKISQSYYDVDTLTYNIDSIIDVSDLKAKTYKTTNPNNKVVDGVLYSSKTNTLLAYPALKEDVSYTVLPSTVNIASSAFVHNQKLQTLNLPQSVIGLGNKPFFNTQIQTINMFDNLLTNDEIGLKNALNNSNVKTFNVDAYNEIPSQTIHNVKAFFINAKMNISYKKNISSLQFEAKRDGAYVSLVTDTNSTSIIIPEIVEILGEVYNVVGINDNVFSSCTSLTSVSIPKTLTTVGANNFSLCTSLLKLDLGSANITTFGANNLRADMEVYTNSKTTLNTIKTLNNKAVSVDWQLLIEREHEGMGQPTGVSSYNHFKYDLTINGKTYTMESDYEKTISGSFDTIMIIFPENTENMEVSLTASISAAASSSADYIHFIQEQISLSKKGEDGNFAKLLGTPTDQTYANHYDVADVEVTYPNGAEPVYVKQGDELQLRVYFTVVEAAQCFTKGTQVTLADGTYKNIEDVTYDDLLLTYDFDNGQFSTSYPVWIAKPGTYSYYYLMEFDDGSTIDIVLSHRLFVVDKMNYEKSIDADFSNIGKKFLKQVIVDGKPSLTTVTCTNITKIKQQVEYYNMVTSQALNFFSNGFIGATGIANMYTFDKIDEQTYVHNQAQLKATKEGTDADNGGTRFRYERFNTAKIPYYVYVAYRLGELRNMVNILSNVPPYNKLPLKQVEGIAIKLVDDYFPESYLDDMVKMPSTFKATFSDRETANRYKPNSTIKIPTPTNQTNFIGWYNTYDGKIYMPNDECSLDMNTHFIAKYSA